MGVYLLKEVAERLRSLRESVKLSQVKMAEIVGVKQSSLNRYELNQASPTFETDRKSTRLNSSHLNESRMPSSA